ncbi:PH domain-containing protein [Gordonia sinesedis]
MAYPAGNLAAGERVVVHRHPHWKRLIGPLLLFILGTGVTGVLAGLVDAPDLDPTARTALWIAIAVLWGALFVWFFLRPLIAWRSTHFVLTDRRVMFRNGVLTRSGLDIPIRRINTVEFRHGPIDRMLRTGTLVIESASDEPLALHDIPRVERVHALLYHEVLDLREDELDRQDLYYGRADRWPDRGRSVAEERR